MEGFRGKGGKMNFFSGALCKTFVPPHGLGRCIQSLQPVRALRSLALSARSLDVLPGEPRPSIREERGSGFRSANGLIELA